MSFGGFGGFGASNNQNQQNQSTGFGGFGQSTNTTGGFGSNTNTGTGFGSSTTGNTGGSLFGGNASTGGFGSGGGFGANASTSSPFGGAAKPAFGATTTSNTGSLFGGGNTSSATGGFGGFGANNNTSTGFGSAATPTQNKPAFGTSGTTGGSLFGGGGGGTTGGFGSTATTSGGFGGFGQQNNQSQAQNQGTAATPFSAHQEKDTGTNNTSYYQSITFQQPYQNYSFEELRVADYNAGRRYGNSNGQAGAFGQTTGFGGFGSSAANTTGGFGSTNNNQSGSLFGGGNNATSSPFGQSQNTTSGFGGGGLFGSNNNNQAKPAGGLFGSTPASSGTTSGGLFGSAAPSTGTTGFGGFGNSTTNTSGGGLFGAQGNQNQAQTQNKPFGGFGSSTTTGTGGFGATNTGGFGAQSNTNTSGGLFGGGAATNNSPFGGAQQSQSTGGSTFGGFGANNNQQNQQQQGTTGGSLFGGFGNNNNNQTQQKPGGLFGSTTTTTPGGGLFGNNQNQQTQQNQTGGGLFGNTQNNQQSGGLFGNKPATTGGLFGGAQASSTPSGGLFGNTNQTQNTGGGLFGNTTQQKPGGLFGGSTTTSNTGGGLFGGLNQSTNQNQSGGGLFGGSTNNQNAGSSLFGGSQQNQQQQNNQQQNQGLMASLLQNPYGNDQLFANLGTPTPSVGPIATPLSGANKQKRPSLPAFKINASQSMRLITPQKRPNAYGFSYSTYGTPGSAQSFTPGRNSILGSGSIGRSLSKSLSTSNLRTSLSAEDSVLAPGAFTPNARPYSSGSSVRRLKIDRSLRTDLFGPDGVADRPNKRVSFDGAGANGIKDKPVNGDTPNGTSNSLVRTETDGPEPSSEELGLLRAPRPQSKEPRANGSLNRPEMEQVRGNELAMVPEDEQVSATDARPTPRQTPRSQADQEPGEYYISPSLQELRDMPREKLKRVTGFTVGRVGIGKIEFDEVDMTSVPLDRILGDIVKLNVRSATVYETGVNTPPEGKGLNVPSTITLENSWPRSHGGRLPVHEHKGPRYDKHIERLRRVVNTEFISYNPETGEWVFRVQHFTTYGLDDDDDETMMDPSGQDTPQGQYNAAAFNDANPVSATQFVMSDGSSNADDTFDFKKTNKKSLPGGFGDQSVLEDDEMDEDLAHEDEGSDVGTDASLDDPFIEHHALVTVRDSDDEHDMAGSFPESTLPKSILKTAMPGDTPARTKFEMNDDWAAQLQRTLSPKKQDRRALREQQTNLIENGAVPAVSPTKHITTDRPFNTTMDIMNSLWAQPKSSSTQARGGMNGFEWPYDRQNRLDLDTSNMNKSDQDFHNSFKPTWTADGTLVYAIAGNTPIVNDDLMANAGKSVVAEGKDIRFARIKAPADADAPSLHLQLRHSNTSFETGPFRARTNKSLTFSALADASKDAQYPLAQNERQIWQLTSLLFDSIELACADLIDGIPKQQIPTLTDRIRRDAVTHFWADLCKSKATAQARDAKSPEEKALFYLSGREIEKACEALVEAGDLKLATIVSQMPVDGTSKQMMRKQIEAWRSQNVLSEISLAVRALYEIAAGNACVSEGKSGAAEDRALTFCIAEQFGLDWKQALGLRLWYCESDMIAAVRSYDQELQEGKEKVKPISTSYQVSGWSKGRLDERDDTLVSLLRFYAATHLNMSVEKSVSNLLDAVAVSGSPVNARMTWQLATIMRTLNIIDSRALPDATVDDLTISLAAQLENAGKDDLTVSAIAVLLHLSSSEASEKYIKDLLNRRAATLPKLDAHADTTTNPVFDELTNKLRIPSSWIHTALALHAASTRDYYSQVSHLLSAGNLISAHDVLCASVGPAAVIGQDYDVLRELLGIFIGDSGASPDIANWRTGGAVYFDFIHLVDLAGPRGDEGESREEKSRILKSLGMALPGMRDGKTSGPGAGSLQERVAIAEMAEVVKKEVVRMGKEEKIMDQKRLERLPVPDDAFVKQGVKIAGLYYAAIQVR